MPARRARRTRRRPPRQTAAAADGNPAGPARCGDACARAAGLALWLAAGAVLAVPGGSLGGAVVHEAGSGASSFESEYDAVV